MPVETVVDCVGLVPPEPMQRVLEAVAAADASEVVCMRIHREPVPLYAILSANGYAHETRPAGEGLFEVRIWRDPAVGRCTPA
jgi:hypothetical protein